MRAHLTIAIILLLGSSLGFSQSSILGTEAQQAAGKVIYDAKCSQCHGYEGDAASVGKEYFRPQPRDFTGATFKFRTTPNGELPLHEDIKKSIKNGMPYTGMPPWPTLSDEDLDNLAYYIKSFAAEDFEEYGVVDPVPLPSAPAFSEAAAERGKIVFDENQCMDCHGLHGRGDGKSAPTLNDQWNIPIRPADLTKRWTFRGGATREDIFRTFTTGLDGSPMPAYDIEPVEDKWALVDYVYTMGVSDEAPYATYATATPSTGELDVSQGESLFAEGSGALFPVFGQIVEPDRAFYPGVNSIEVKATYTESEIAIGLFWHDMTSETIGNNHPSLDAPDDPSVVDTLGEYSDAIAVILPSEMPVGQEKPYFMFGDPKRSTDVWFADLADDAAERLTGFGISNMQLGDANLEIHKSYEHGRWSVIMKAPRDSESAMPLAEGSFVPIAFSVWDGFAMERGNKRGLTSWYNLYIEPMETESAAFPMFKWGFIVLVIELAIVGLIRMKNKN